MISSSSEARRADVIRHKTPGGPPNGASGMNRHRKSGPRGPMQPARAPRPSPRTPKSTRVDVRFWAKGRCMQLEHAKGQRSRGLSHGTPGTSGHRLRPTRRQARVSQCVVPRNHLRRLVRSCDGHGSPNEPDSARNWNSRRLEPLSRDDGTPGCHPSPVVRRTAPARSRRASPWVCRGMARTAVPKPVTAMREFVTILRGFRASGSRSRATSSRSRTSSFKWSHQCDRRGST